MTFMTMRGSNNADGSYDWRGAVLDSGIMAAVTFFSSLGGLAAAIAGATQFFIALAIKRGLRETKP